MENVWQNLFAPEARIVGRWLRTYSLWHHALLTALDSPFLHPAPRVNASDLLAAVQVCRTSFPARPAFPPRLSWRLRLLRRTTLSRHAEALGRWMLDHISGPLFWHDPKKALSGGLTAPDVFSLVYGLTSKCGLSHAEAWNTSPGQASTILGTVAELEGADLSFADPDELTDDSAPDQLNSRAAIYQQAVADLGQTRADQFIRAWDASHNSN